MLLGNFKKLLILDHCQRPGTWIIHSYITVQNLSNCKGNFLLWNLDHSLYSYRRITFPSAALRVLKSKLMEKCNTDEPATSGTGESRWAFRTSQHSNWTQPPCMQHSVIVWFKYLYNWWWTLTWCLENDQPEINFWVLLRCLEHYRVSFFLAKKQIRCFSRHTLTE